MDPIRDERSEGCQQAANDGQYFMQRSEGSVIVCRVNIIEAVPVETDIPIGDVVDHEVYYSTDSKGGIELFVSSVVAFVCSTRREGARVTHRSIEWAIGRAL